MNFIGLIRIHNHHWWTGVPHCLMCLAQFISLNIFHLQDFGFASRADRSKKSITVSTIYNNTRFFIILSDDKLLHNPSLELGVCSNVFIFRGNDE